MVKSWCLRNSDPAMPCIKDAKEDFLKCNADGESSDLWYGFLDDKTCNPSLLLPNANDCHKLISHLNQSFKVALSKATKKNTKEQILEDVKKDLAPIYGEAVTKQHLERALQLVKTSPAPLPTAIPQTFTSLPNSQPNKTVQANLNTLTLSETTLQPQQATSDTSVIATPGIPTSQIAAPSDGPSSTAVDDIPAPKTISLAGVKQATRPTGANDGTVYTNHFTIDLKENTKLYEYQIVGLRSKKDNLSRPKKRVMIARKIAASEVLNNNRDAFACNDHGRIIAWRPLKEGVQENDIIDTTPVNYYSREQPGVVAGQLDLDVVFKRVIDLNGYLSFAQRKNPQYEDTGAASALDILISSGARTENTTTGLPAVVKIDDNRFFTPENEEELKGGHGLVALRGYSSCVQPVDGGLRLNVNTALSAFYKEQKVIDVIEAFKDRPSAFPHGKGAQHLIGVRVKILYDRCKPDEINKDMDSLARRTKTITGFSSTSASHTMFDRNGKQISVWQHFDETYPKASPRPRKDQICVNTSSTEKGKECWFMPDQLLIVPGQLYRKTLDKVNPELPAAMIALACRRPSWNKAQIMDTGLAALGLHKPSPNSEKLQPQIQALRDAGMRVASEMLEVPFKKVRTPTIQYGNTKKPITLTESASWKTTGQEFLTHSKRVGSDDLVQFLYLEGSSLELPETYTEAFLGSFQENLGTQTNTVRSDLQPIKIVADTKGLSTLEADLEKFKAKLAVLILPDDNKDIRQLHANFRIVNDQQLGGASIVLNETRMLKVGARTGPSKLKGYMASNAMKLNVRFGNENHSVKDGFTQLMADNLCNTLVLGADLIHPSQASAEGAPSIAAVVGSVSATFGKFLGSARHQPKGSEIINLENMKDMATERIKAWQNSSGLAKGLPPRILYFRDGTGLTQYSGILEEIVAIKAAWMKLYKALNPKPLFGPKSPAVTAIVAVKRHSTRFYPINNEKESRTATGNCRPGIVVDTHITSPLYTDFFLQSHDVEKGSAKPTHYFVLSNDMKLKDLDVMQLTNNFCYTFAHSTSAVSYPSPVYCADKLCERAMLYLHHINENMPSVKNMDKDEIAREVNTAWQRGGRGRDQKQANPWHANLDDKMFWM